LARVLAATNKELFSAIKNGLFREDLYHRLSVLTVRVPSLHERHEDKAELLFYFMQQVAAEVATFQLDEEALKLWNDYTFPGNVRELRNIIIRLSAKYPGQTIKAEVLKREMTGLQRHDATLESEDWLSEALHQADFQLDQLLKLVEKKAIDLAMREYAGNVSKAAAMLGINRTTLYGRMDRQEDRD
jgi:DNA-binding NtrC family response regulator